MTIQFIETIRAEIYRKVGRRLVEGWSKVGWRDGCIILCFLGWGRYCIILPYLSIENSADRGAPSSIIFEYWYSYSYSFVKKNKDSYSYSNLFNTKNRIDSNIFDYNNRLHIRIQYIRKITNLRLVQFFLKINLDTSFNRPKTFNF